MTWSRVKISEVMLVTDYVANGSFAALKENVKYSYEPNYAVLVRTTDNTKNWNDQYVYVNQDSYEFLSKSKLYPNDIIISNVGEPGKAFLCPDLGKPMTLGPNSILVRPLDMDIIDNRFFFYYTISSIGQGQIEKICSATTQKKFNKTSYRSLEFMLPPLPIQKKIAAILDAADEYRQKTKALIEKYDELAQSLFLNMFGDPVRNEKGWMKVELGSVSNLITKGESPKWQGFGYVDNGVRFVTSENVRMGFLDTTKDKFIPIEFHKKLNRSQLTKNDILVNLVGASIGRGAIVTEAILPANINQAVAKVELNTDLINPQFMLQQIITKRIQESLIGNKVEGARANISLKNVRELLIINPPKEVQNQFIDRLRVIRIQIEYIKSSFIKSDDLFKGLLQRAFKGELYG